MNGLVKVAEWCWRREWHGQDVVLEIRGQFRTQGSLEEVESHLRRVCPHEYPEVMLSNWRLVGRSVGGVRQRSASVDDLGNAHTGVTNRGVSVTYSSSVGRLTRNEWPIF